VNIIHLYGVKSSQILQISRLLKKSNFYLIRRDLAQPVFLCLRARISHRMKLPRKYFWSWGKGDIFDDISLAAENLAWAPEVNLEEGLRRTIAYFKKSSAPKAINKHEKSGLSRGGAIRGDL
jgi:hypothetical protein